MVAQQCLNNISQLSISLNALTNLSSRSNSGRTHSIHRLALSRPRRLPPRHSTLNGRIRQNGSSNQCSSNGSSNPSRCHRPCRGRVPTQPSPKFTVSALRSTILINAIVYLLPRPNDAFCSCSSANKSWFGLLKLRRIDVALRLPIPTRTPTTTTPTPTRTSPPRRPRPLEPPPVARVAALAPSKLGLPLPSKQ